MQAQQLKVLCPLERTRADGESKTYWMPIGRAYTNRDGSFNVYLDALPTNQKLQIRELDERDLERMEKSRREERGENDSLPF